MGQYTLTTRCMNIRSRSCNNGLDTPEKANATHNSRMYRFRKMKTVEKAQRKTNPIKWIRDMNG